MLGDHRLGWELPTASGWPPEKSGRIRCPAVLGHSGAPVVWLWDGRPCVRGFEFLGCGSA